MSNVGPLFQRSRGRTISTLGVYFNVIPVVRYVARGGGWLFVDSELSAEEDTWVFAHIYDSDRGNQDAIEVMSNLYYSY